MAEATYRRKHFLFVSQVSLGSPGHPDTIPVVQADLEYRVVGLKLCANTAWQNKASNWVFAYSFSGSIHDQWEAERCVIELSLIVLS